MTLKLRSPNRVRVLGTQLCKCPMWPDRDGDCETCQMLWQDKHASAKPCRHLN